MTANTQCDKYTHPPCPTLLGNDLVKLYYRNSKPAYLALLVSDWSGDVHRNSEMLFSSFREQDYEFDAEKSEIRFKKSRTTLNICDAIERVEIIPMEDPRKLFGSHKKRLHTAALYYRDHELCRIGPDHIGGVDEMRNKKKGEVQYFCSVRLKFGDEAPIYRLIKRFGDIPRLVHKGKDDGNGWRLARNNEWAIGDRYYRRTRN